MAYQGFGLGVDRAKIATLAALMGTGPDLTLVLDVSAAVAARRLSGRGGTADRYEALDPAFHERVRAGFRAIAAAAPDRCVRIDADPEAEVVQAAVMAAVRARLGAAAGGAVG